MATEREDAESEELLKFGAVKSSYSLIELAASQIENRLLNTDENLNDSPASFVNIFLENFARLGSQSFYEQMMYKNEMTPSTAIKLRSIVNKLKSEDISSIYAYPARMTYVLGYNYDTLIKLLKENDNYIIINKECLFTMDGQESFVLDHNIKIVLSNPGTVNQNVYAVYQTNDIDNLNIDSNLTEVNNIYIQSQVFYYNNTKIFGLFLNTRQMTRTEKDVIVTSTNPDFTANFTDQLYGFEMHYKAVGTDSFVKKSGMFDGNANSEGYNFELDLDSKTISISFNRTPNYWKPSIGDEIKLIIYTTKGSSGNFTVPDIYNAYNQVSFEYKQDKDDTHQDCIVKTLPYISIKDSGADSGRDTLSFSEIRALAINRGSNSNIITPGNLELKASELGFSTKKIRSDIRSLEYRLSTIMKDSDNIILSRNNTITFNFEDIPLNSEVSNRMISPKSVYKYNEDTGKCEYLKTPDTYEEYFNAFQENKYNEYQFPFHIKFISTSQLQVEIYNMNRNNESYNLNFLYYNEKTSFENSIMNLIVNRNALTEDINNIPKSKTSITRATGYFDISFQVSTSAVVIANLLSNEENKIVKYKVSINDGNNNFLVESHIFTDEIDSENNTLIVHAYIRTDDAILNKTSILTRDFCLQPIPFITNPIEYYFISNKVNFRIFVLEKSTDSRISSTYDNILTTNEKNNLYFVSTVYSINDVTLFEDYTDYFSLPSDITISQKQYPTYDSDVYKTYENDEYVYNSDGTPITEYRKISINDEFIEVSVTKKLHSKGDFVYKSNLETPISNLAEAISILTDNDIETLKTTKSLTELAKMIEFDVGNLSDSDLITYLDKFLGLKFESVKENNRTYLKNIEDNSYINDSILNKLQNKLNTYRVKTILHKAGDINPSGAILKDETYIGVIKNVAMYNRIYSIGDTNNNIYKIYENLLSKFKTMNSVIPDGVSLCLGINNTSGTGDYEVYNLNSSTWRDIDDISVSLTLGVKYLDNANNDTESDNELIIETIKNYINNFEDITFGIDNIFEEVKDKVPSIEYLVLYKINQYSASEVQSIRKKNGESNILDKLCVKQVIDTKNTDLNSNIIKFKPDITVRVIS